MLSKLVLALIILTIGGAIQVGSVDGLNENADDIPTPLPDNYLPIRPGENITISFQILLDKGHASINVPVPEIYTYDYLNNHRLLIEEKSYEYLTCNAYDKINITEVMKTFNMSVNVTVLENNSIFYIDYIFAPPKGEYNDDIVFFIQDIEDISYIEAKDEVLDWVWTSLILVIPIVIIGFFCLLQVSEPSRGRRRRTREIERDYQQSLERLRVLRRGLEEYRPSHSSSAQEPSRPPSSPPPLPTVFKCRNKKNGMREFVKGDGMFEIGIKKFKVPSFDEQVKMINELPGVENFNLTTLQLVVNLNEHGKYFLKLKATPTAYRVEDDETMSYRNPYIHNGDFHLCLGTGQKLYNRCYENKHYVECIRILCEVLKSKHGTGYRKWSDCGM